MANTHDNLAKKAAIGVLLLAGVVLSIMAGYGFVYLGVSTTLLLVSGLLGMVFLLRKPFQSLLMFVFLLPSEVLIIGTPGATILRYVGVEVALIWLVHLMARRRSIIFRKRSLLYLAFFGLSWLSLLWAPAPEVGFQFAITYLQLALLLVILLDQVTSLARLKQIIIVLAAGGILAIAIFYLFGDFNQMGRLSLVPIGGPGLATYGYPLAFSVTLLGVLGILGNGRSRIVGAIGYIAGFYPLIGMGLRGALLAMATGMGAAAIVVAGRKRSAVIVAVLALALLIGAINYLSETGILPIPLIEHLTISDAMETKGSNRLPIWQVVLDVVPQHPIFGLGLNQFGNYVYRQNMYPVAVSVHNDYLDTLVNLGGVGAIVLVSAELITVIYLLKARQYVKKQDIVWYGVLVALIFASIVAQNFVDELVYKYVWVIRAIVIAGSYPDLWRGETELAQSAPATGPIERMKRSIYYPHLFKKQLGRGRARKTRKRA
jgi:O-antigen ligase